MTKRINILIVENERIVALNICNRLEEMGYRVVEVVSSGEAAIRSAESLQPDLVLMDVRMPGSMDGIQAAERIQTQFKIPVVYLTAYSDQETLQRVKLTQPYGYILKPFEARELYSAIEIALYKHQQEQELKAREQWLSTTLRSIGDAVITTDRQGLITFMNPVAEELTGWSLPEALGKAVGEVFKIINEHTRQAAQNPIMLALKQGITVNLSNQTLLLPKMGTEIPIDDSAAPIKNEEGDVIGAVLVFHNITERKQFERELQTLNQELETRVQERTQELDRRKQEFVTLVENAPDIIARFDREYRHLYVNPAVELATGRPAQEFIGKTNRELRISEDITPLREQAYQVVFESGQEHTVEFDLLTPNGVRYYQLRVVPERSPEGTIDSIMTIARDITTLKQTEMALRQSEERFRASVESMLDGFAILSALRDENGQIIDFRYEYINRAGCLLMNYIAPSELLGKRLCDVLPAHRETGLLEEYRRVIETGQPFVKESFFYEDTYGDGQRLNRALDIQIVKLKDSFVATWRDVTERKRSETRLQESLEEKNVLLKEVHHRVKNNLQTISSLLKLQAAKVQDQIVLDALRESQNRVLAIASVHEELYQSPSFAKINFAGHIRRLVAQLCRSYNAQQRSIQVRVEIAEVELSIDTVLPCSLIINELVSNAFKHAFPGDRSGEITIRFAPKSPDQLHQYILLVQDNGIGLPRNLDICNTPTLGLQLVYSLVRQLRGHIEQEISGNALRITFSS